MPRHRQRTAGLGRELEDARRILRVDDPKSEINVYDGLVTGLVTRSVLSDLLAAGLMVDRSSSTPDDPPPQEVPGVEAPLAMPELQSRVPANSARRANCVYTITVRNSGKPLRVLLAWTDAPVRFLQNTLQNSLSLALGVSRANRFSHPVITDYPIRSGGTFATSPM